MGVFAVTAAVPTLLCVSNVFAAWCVISLCRGPGCLCTAANQHAYAMHGLGSSTGNEAALDHATETPMRDDLLLAMLLSNYSCR